MTHNFRLLEDSLNFNLFGQPLVKKTVLEAIKGHLKIPNPPKALVLSMHGGTGTGKNYVVDIIANSLYLRGRESRFYKYFSSQRDFPHNTKLNEYKVS